MLLDSDTDRENNRSKQLWVKLRKVLLLHEITKENFPEHPKIVQVPSWVIFSWLLVNYNSWSEVHGLGSMVGRVDEETPMRRHVPPKFCLFCKNILH